MHHRGFPKRLVNGYQDLAFAEEKLSKAIRTRRINYCGDRWRLAARNIVEVQHPLRCIDLIVVNE
jgi:hypothetical protein